MQVPPPPQAEGKNTFWFTKVDNKVPPEATSIFFSPLMVMVTGPEGDNFSLVNNNTLTKSNKSTKKAITVMVMVPMVEVANIMLIRLFGYQ
jgi:hypothetical protein